MLASWALLSAGLPQLFINPLNTLIAPSELLSYFASDSPNLPTADILYSLLQNSNVALIYQIEHVLCLPVLLDVFRQRHHLPFRTVVNLALTNYLYHVF